VRDTGIVVAKVSVPHALSNIRATAHPHTVSSPYDNGVALQSPGIEMSQFTRKFEVFFPTRTKLFHCCKYYDYLNNANYNCPVHFEISCTWC